jgi:hypothetical protein
MQGTLNGGSRAVPGFCPRRARLSRANADADNDTTYTFDNFYIFSTNHCRAMFARLPLPEARAAFD